MLSNRTRDLPASSTAALDARVKALIADGVDLVNLTGGELDFPTPEQAGEGAKQAIDSGYTRYTPVAGITALRQAIADRLRTRWETPYQAADIVTANGAKQALAQLITVLCDPGDEVILQAPHWVSFPHMIRLVGAAPVIVPTQNTGFKLTPAGLSACLSPRSKVLLLNNPSNPTGVVYSAAELRELAETARAHRLTIISDEIYGDLVHPGARFTSVASLSPDIAEHTVTVAGFSKTFAMTGWRIGFAAAPPPIAQALAAVQGHTSSAPSSISQYAALAALSREAEPELARRCAELADRRDLLVRNLDRLAPLRLAAPAQGGFFAFVDVRGLYTSGEDTAASVAARLLDDTGVAVMPAADFGAPHHVRISYAVSAEAIKDATERLAAHLTRQPKGTST